MGKYLRTDEIIDLELFVAEDERESEDYKNNRDFEFYSQASEYDKADEINLLSFWIEKMRALSKRVSVGKFAQLIYVLYALGLIVIGGLGGFLFGLVGSSEFYMYSYLLVASVCFIFTPLLLGVFARVANWKIAFLSRIFLGKRANLGLVEKKNKNYFRARGKFLSQFFGLAFVLAMFFGAYGEFGEERGIGESNIGESEVECVYNTAKIIALPWSFTMGEGVLYPSLEDVEWAKEHSYAPYSEEQKVWANFLLLGIFVYGILPRVIIFFVCFARARNGFGKYKVSNDRDVNILINRMKLSSSNKTNWQGLKNDKDCKNLLLLRSDLMDYSDIIKQRGLKQIKFDKFNVFKYNYLSEFFDENFTNLQVPYNNFTIAFLSDDYNDEVFENMQNLINTYPEKTLNVLLLGRYDKAGNVFEELVSVEKSWWERKLNAISTQNINIY